MRIGIFGGSFNPIHTGHAIVANYISQVDYLDEIWLVPSRINPLKQGGQPPVSGRDRLEMCRLVANECANVGVSDIELHMPEPSYTYNTLCALRSRYPENDFKLIIGSDNWEIFSQWRDYKKIIDEFGVIIYMRAGYEIAEESTPNVRLEKEGPQIFLSSTMIRGKLKDGWNLNFVIPEKVLQYIKDNGLYE